MNMHDIVDYLYQRATDFMHQGGLCMDEDYVGKQQNNYLWCFISESKTAGVWGCPMRFTSGCCAGIRITEKGRYLKTSKFQKIRAIIPPGGVTVTASAPQAERPAIPTLSEPGQGLKLP